MVRLLPTKGHSHRIDPNAGENWDTNFLEFLLFHLEIMNRKASTLKTKIAAVRFFHVVHGKADFTLGNNRAKTLIKGVENGNPRSEKTFQC